jgi:methylisocitrate lyase
MSSKHSTPGQRFRDAVASEHPLQVVGAINANHALLAKRAGFKAIYLSGGGVAAGSLGVPDLGITGLDDVLTDVRRITDVCDLPLLVDVDTGFGSSAFNVARTVKSLWPPSEQRNRQSAGNGRSHQSRRRCPYR